MCFKLFDPYDKTSVNYSFIQYSHMGQGHGCYLRNMNVALVFLSVKSSGEFTAQ
jgi:hypothetical protein